jgi:hypothetical protein
VLAHAESALRTKKVGTNYWATGYVSITCVDILYAGPNSFNGSQPHVWYVCQSTRIEAGGWVSEGIEDVMRPAHSSYKLAKVGAMCPKVRFPSLLVSG